MSALAIITAADLALRGGSGVCVMYAVVPALALLQGADQRRFHLTGVAAFSVCFLLAVIRGREDALASAAGVAAVMVVCGIGCLGRLRRLADTQAVAEVVQRALLRPLPSRLGPLRLETRYLASAPQAQVGGDVYDAAWTPYGIRLLIGDVMGNGLGTVETAGRLLGAFREAAYDEEDLASLAWRLHVGLSRDPGVGERGVFATALLVNVSPAGDVAEVLSCGHPPPLLLRSDGGVEEVEIGSPLPPLGMLELSQEHVRIEVGLRPGDGLLLYTDGFTEARDADGEFFPLARHAACGEPEDLVQRLVDDLAAHVGDRLGDDAALVMLRRHEADGIKVDDHVRHSATP
ncbi:PP2C family protein-serine/threonine phosphatase [Actinoallomurus bryophytorum]|uniref:PP2C family protein-serine/threonine phosphatase n=1 Tax=Actinoallomurus bryophytorum TaxID=1490222 RepID=UPI00163B10CC|nr:PP2C family protein-serine/threonine phosphatase [Actinoallomurus bryophytorum]